MRYKQCALQKGNLQTTSWLPERHAKVGGIVHLKTGDDWGRNWTVLSASEPIEGRLIEGQSHNSGDIWAPSAKITNRGNK